MKKLCKLLLALTLGASLFACGENGGGNNQQAQLNKLEQIQEAGVLVVATSPDFPPNEFIDPSKSGDEQYVGSDIELAKFVAQELGVELKLEISDFSTVLASFQIGAADLIISGIGYKEDRLEAMDFTKTYNPSNPDSTSYQGLMVKVADQGNYTKLEDFNKPEVKIAVQSGSLQEGYATSQLPNATIEIFGGLSDAILSLQMGAVDAIAMASGSGESYASNNDDIIMSGIAFELNPRLEEFDGTLMGVPKDEPEFLAALNEIVDKILEQGLYEKWYEEATEYAISIGAE